MSNHCAVHISAILNVSKSATDAEIHERHRSLSLIFHPDKHRSEDFESLATEKFLEVQKAYEGSTNVSREPQNPLSSLSALIFSAI
jgi:preprotein translocase subunit Sec63